MTSICMRKHQLDCIYTRAQPYKWLDNPATIISSTLLNLTHGSHSEAKRKADNEVVEMESEKEGNKRQMQQELDNTRTALREELSFNASATVRRKSTTGKKNK